MLNLIVGEETWWDLENLNLDAQHGSNGARIASPIPMLSIFLIPALICRDGHYES